MFILNIFKYLEIWIKKTHMYYKVIFQNFLEGSQIVYSL